MILLINEQSVIFEVLNGIRVRAAKQLQIPHDWVQIRLERDRHLLKKATFHPVIELSLPSENDPTMAPIAEDAKKLGVRAYTLSPDDLQKELRILMELARAEINVRLAGLDA